MTRNRGLTMSAVAALCASLAAQSPQPKMGDPLNDLTATERSRFDDGAIDFRHVFQVSEGLGPIFNQNACSTCHSNPIGGSGAIFVTRFGFYDPKGVGWDPLETLGGSLLQANTIDQQCSEVVPTAANVTAQRVTTSTLGLGLIEAIPDSQLLAYANNPPSPAVSGRAHMVTPLEDPTGPQRVGRFGWKSQVATVLSFSGDAAQNELGLTNRLIPTENAPNGDTAAVALCDTVPDPEDTPDAQGLEFIDRVTFFQRYLAAPPQTPRSGMTGEQIFNNVGCADCHVTSYTTSSDPSLEQALRNKTIKPYSDFLLHDMGFNADFIGQGQADLQEMRTPALWGVRVRNPLWHDGRVTGGTFEQLMIGTGGIIDQHNGFGSEAAPSAQAFLALPANDQLAVVAFLDSLGKREFDSNGDNTLDRIDYQAFRLAQNGGPYTPDDPEAVFDFDQDGDVDQTDLDAMALVYDEDCNGNGQNDLLDLLTGASVDFNFNGVPDECDFCQTDLGSAGGGTLELSICGDALTTAGARASLWIKGADPGAPLLYALSPFSVPTPISPTETLVPAWPPALLGFGLVANAYGQVQLPLQAAGPGVTTWIIQSGALNANGFDLSNAVSLQLGL
ncbi:MAG: di-heme oxidoredictase family protein [Planctomycetota bacterium]|nr:di-heme oxidoredictase family protein [Planctomycetota bacterium]